MKAELHLHLFGAMPKAFLAKQLRKNPPRKALEKAPQRHLEFFERHENIRTLIRAERPEEAVDGLLRFESFGNFLGTYLFTGYFVKDADDLRGLIDAVCRDLAAQGIAYAEITISLPEQLRQGIPLDATLACMEEARRRKDLKIGWIVDFVRDFGPDAALALARDLARHGRDALAGVTIGGSEHKVPPEPFAPAYRVARDAGWGLTAHAGEAAGPESVRGALDALGAQRIGHGTRAVEDPALVARLAREGIPLEVCPTSNLRTGVVRSMAEHPVRRLFEAGVPITLSTDDPTFFGTDLASEYAALASIGFSEPELVGIARNGFEHAFLPAEEKRQFFGDFDRKARGA